MSKKKSVPLVWLLCLVLMISTVVFISCQEPSMYNFGSLTVSTSALGSRTISPGSTEIAVASYRVSGIGPDDETFTPVTSDSSPITVPDLIEGTWRITVEGLNTNDIVIANTTQDVIIQARQTTDAYFNLVSLTGTGDFALTLTWPESVTSVAKITASLDPEVEGKSGFTVFASEATTSDGLRSITKTIMGLPTGSYALKVNFLDASDNMVAYPMMEQVNIYKEMASNGTFALPEYMFPVEAPLIFPNGGRIDSNQAITLSTITDGAVIYYTLDGSDPDTSDTVFTSPFTLPFNKTVKAIAVRGDMASSTITSVTFEVPAASPTFSLAEGTYDESQTVTLSSVASEVNFFYTTDGSIPTDESTEYTGPIVISENTVLRAIAVYPGYGFSDPSTFEYKIKASIPSFSLREGAYSGTQTVVLSSATPDATVYYTIDGATPTSSSMVYTTPLEIASTTTLKAVSGKPSMELSAVASVIYNIYLNAPVASPTFTPSQGTYPEAQEVVLSSTTEGASIYYTLNGTEPTKSSILYTSAITVSANTTLKAYAVKEGAADSSTVSAEYVIQVIAPTFSVVAGTYTESKELSLSTTTEGASIWYTLNGSTPTTGSTLYTGAITLDNSTTVKAIATKFGMANSNAAEASYVIAGMTGLNITDPALFEVKIVVPSDWTGEPVITNIGAKIVASITPFPSDVEYSWYLDGVEARNREGEIASTNNILRFGLASSNVAIGPGPHVLMVRVGAGSKSFSDYYYFRVSDSGTVGSSEYLLDIGEEGLAGGLVFYDKGSSIDGWRYLEAAPYGWYNEGDDPYIQWGAFGYTVNPSSTATTVGTGDANTANIVSYHDMLFDLYPLKGDYYTNAIDYYPSNDGTVAAKVCSEYSVVNGGTTYDDWFLPSKDELDLMYGNLGVYGLGGFNVSGYGYWSSSEINSTNVWNQSFYDGGQYNVHKLGGNKVRPVRVF